MSLGGDFSELDEFGGAFAVCFFPCMRVRVFACVLGWAEQR